tara:strand:+ start:2730 stop:2945 length:216 start_codon:yes stop_codon:yes gene_type:complete
MSMRKKSYADLVRELADKRTQIKELRDDQQFATAIIKVAMRSIEKGKPNTAFELLDQIITPTQEESHGNQI